MGVRLTTRDSQPEQAESGPLKDAREAAKRAEQRAKAAETKLIEREFAYLGIDTTKGLGATMLRDFSADTEAEVDSLQTWLRDHFEWEQPTEEDGGAQPEEEANEDDQKQAAADLIHQATGRADGVTSTGSQGATTETALEEAARIEQEQGPGPQSINAKIRAIAEKVVSS